MNIGWMIGNQRWAYRHLAMHLMTEMKDIEHSVNAKGDDFTVFLAPDQLTRYRVDKRTILHLDGNRWNEADE